MKRIIISAFLFAISFSAISQKQLINSSVEEEVISSGSTKPGGNLSSATVPCNQATLQSLLEKISRQEKLITEQQIKITTIMNQLDMIMAKGQTSVQWETLENNAGSSLEQNSPNPFRNSTGIKYSLPAGTKEAHLRITNSKGGIVKDILLKDLNKGQIMLNAANLTSGHYYYSLVVNGQVVMTKDMQVIH